MNEALAYTAFFAIGFVLTVICGCVMHLMHRVEQLTAAQRYREVTDTGRDWAALLSETGRTAANDAAADRQTRLRCLELAVGSCDSTTTADLVDAARVIERFAKGTVE